MRVLLGLLALCVLAFLLRALSFEGVFVGDTVLFAAGDGYYHARIALWDFVNFPSILTFDPYINYPDGASVPAPPLQDFLVAAVARALGGDPALLERVLAWWSPVMGALTPVPVYLAARKVGDVGVALGAAGLVAAMPILATASHVGNADHHALQALLGATLLWLCLAAVSPGARLRGIGWSLLVMRVAIVLSWSGSLLYLLVADGLLLLTATLAARRDLLAMQALSTLASALALAIVVGLLPEPAGGPWWALSLSRLYPLALLAVAALAGGGAVLEGLRSQRGAPGRLFGLLAAALLVGLAILAAPGPRQGLAAALGFLGLTGTPGWMVAELMPLFALPGRPASHSAIHYFGYYAYLVPLAPLGPLLAARHPQPPLAGRLLAGWAAIFAALTLWQIRYGLDFTPPGSICFALLLAAVGQRLPTPARLRWLRPFLAAALGVMLLWPLVPVYLRPAQHSLLALGAPPPSPDWVLRTPVGSMVRFLRLVREVTPETSGFLDAEGVPEYGVLTRMSVGHPLHYVARRASASDGLLGITGPENFAAAQRFFETRIEGRAVALAKGLGARYVLTSYAPGMSPGTMEARLHLQAGVGNGRSLNRFRLVAEGPKDGRPLTDLFGLPRPDVVVPYRLFEIVAGAVLAVSAPPGSDVTARVDLLTPLRRFSWQGGAVANARGVARIRVPYPTEGSAPTQALGSYRVEAGDVVHRVRVSEAEVRSGSTVRVGPPSPSGD